jgi:oligo-1,6-glucosidase/alpha-glucosidase
LDYIQELGFETIWCSPFFASPQADFGYDITNFREIAPEYGTMNDVEQLIQEVHARKMKIVFDMVMNHTSIQHRWFEEDVRRSPAERGLQQDNYVWRDKPNNWKSMVKGNAWQFNKERGQYFYAAFLPFQPDLNYYNPAIRKAMLDHVRFWLSKGVDGFRLDIFNSIFEDSLFRNNPPSLNPLSNFQNKIYSVNLPASLDFAEELRTLCDSFGEKMLIGEIIGDRSVSKKYCGDEKNNRLTLAFNFEMLRFKFNARYFEKLIANQEKDFAAPFMSVYVYSNHDRRRSLSRLKGDRRKAKLIHAVQFLARGVPCVYNGEEIGMQDLNIPNKEALDPVPHALKLPKWLGNLANETFNRDDVRTPMQWTNRKHAGFSDAEKTWLPVNPNHPTINVQSAQQDSTSLYYFFKKLNNVRNKNLSLSRKGNVLFLNGTILNFNKRKSVKVNGLKVEPLGVVWF